MIKALSAIAISSFIAAAVFVLPGFAPQVEAGAPVALQKSSRLIVHTVDRGCASRLGPTSVPHACMVLARSLSLALSVLTAANRKTFMSSPAVRNDIQIDHGSSAAICEEIGDRLRISLKGAPGRLPQHMMMLIEQMARNDYVSTVLSEHAADQLQYCV